MTMQPPLRSKYIEKRCEHCTKVFLIPCVREGYAQRLICYQSICPLCHPNAQMCRGCYVPFKAKKHYSMGMCRMCYYYHRYDNTKQDTNDNLTSNG